MPTTLGELRAAGHRHRTVKQELRENLLARMRAGEDRFPGIVGYDTTVLPEVERAILAGHDAVLLGERGREGPPDPGLGQPARQVDPGHSRLQREHPRTRSAGAAAGSRVTRCRSAGCTGRCGTESWPRPTRASAT
jgi:hypothetical protein